MDGNLTGATERLKTKEGKHWEKKRATPFQVSSCQLRVRPSDGENLKTLPMN